jgi:hypothetical protein
MDQNRRETQTITVEKVASRDQLRRFLRVPWRIYEDDPNWIPPLLLERENHLDRRKNPYFSAAEAEFWIARRDGEAVGRISAQVNQVHLKRYGDATGHFGFLDADDDPAVFESLTSTVENWLKNRGMKRVTGPFSLSINDESGLLIDGFDTPPYVMMGHAKPYYSQRLEELGYRPAVDLVTYVYGEKLEIPGPVATLLKKSQASGKIKVRSLDFNRYEADLETIIEIFNDAWQDNWGFIPFRDEDIRYLAKNIKPLIGPDYVAIAELDGEPAAMAVMLPNVNEAIADLNGRLLPFGWAKLLWRLKVKGLKTVRMPLMGVKKRYQNSSLGATLAFAVIDRVRHHQKARGVIEAELSWVLKDNTPTRRVIDMMGAHLGKTYRIYEKALS